MSKIHRYARVVKGHPHGHSLHTHHKRLQKQSIEQTEPASCSQPFTLDAAPLTDETVLCRCYQVTVAQVRQAIQDGAATVEQVMTLTDLGSACGHCVGHAWPVVQNLLAGE